MKIVCSTSFTLSLAPFCTPLRCFGRICRHSICIHHQLVINSKPNCKRFVCAGALPPMAAKRAKCQMRKSPLELVIPFTTKTIMIILGHTFFSTSSGHFGLHAGWLAGDVAWHSSTSNNNFCVIFWAICFIVVFMRHGDTVAAIILNEIQNKFQLVRNVYVCETSFE